MNGTNSVLWCVYNFNSDFAFDVVESVIILFIKDIVELFAS